MMFFAINGFSSTSKNISAKSNDGGAPIVINANLAQAFVLPFNDIGLKEPRLQGLPAYANSVQGNKRELTFEKGKLYAVSTRVMDEARETMTLPNNRSFVLYRSVNHPSGQVAAWYIAILDKDGNIIKKASLSNPNLSSEYNFQQPLTMNEAYRFAGGVGITKVSETPNETIVTIPYTSGSGNQTKISFKNIVITRNNQISYREITAETLQGMGSGDNQFWGVTMGPTGAITGNWNSSNGNKLNVTPRWYHINPQTGKLTKKIVTNMAKPSLPTAQELGFPINDTVTITPQGGYGLADGNFLVQSNHAGSANAYKVSLTLFDGKGERKAYVFESGLQGVTAPQFTYIRSLSNDKVLYFTLGGNNTTTKLYRVESGTNRIDLVKQYPNRTSIVFTNFSDPKYPNVKYIGIGFLENKAGELGAFIDSGTFMGYFDQNFSPYLVKNEKKSSSTSPVLYKTLDYQEGVLTVGGKMANNSTFVKYPFPMNIYQSKINSGQIYDAFFGTFKVLEDYAPAMDVGENIIVNLEDPVAHGSNSQQLDQWLLTGSKTGKLTDKTGIKAYDMFDLGEGELTQAWLNSRINRNPNNLSLPIDWTALGYQPNSRGPQEVTYFVTDSLKQVTVSSKIINRVDSDTVVSGKGAMAASNFAIHVNDLDQLTTISAKNHAKLLAWELDTGKIADDGTAGKNGVFLDQVQLQTIKNVKKAYQALKEDGDKSLLIKPYPLKMMYLTPNYEVIERNITIFVTDDTTEVDERNKVVIYGFDFKESLKKVAGLSSADVVALSKGSAWNYTMNRDKGENNAYPVKNITANVTDPVHPTNPALTGLNHVTTVGDYKVKLTYQKTSNHKVTAHIYDDFSTIHIRQIILNEASNLVIPSKGFLMIENIKNQAATDIASNSHITSLSEAAGKKQSFTDIRLEMTYNYWWYRISPIIPEYYQYAGYVATITNQTHDESKKTATLPILDFKKSNEYWVTIYLNPVTENVKSYSWDYQTNKFGKMKP